MGFDQKGTPVFCVTGGENGQWHVSEEGFEKPLATFESLNEAEEYARDLARTKEGSTVRMPNDGQTQADGEQSQSQGPGMRGPQQSPGNRI